MTVCTELLIVVPDYSSSSAIPKVVFRTETSSTYAVLMRLGCRPHNLFDLSTAYRVLEFTHHGRSVFMSPSPSVQTMCEGLGLSTGGMVESRLGRYYRCFQALRRLLVPAALDFLAAKTAIDASIGGGVGDVSREKQRRKELRAEWEVNTLHIRPVSPQKISLLVASLEDVLKAQNLRHKRLIDLGDIRYHYVGTVLFPVLSFMKHGLRKGEQSQNK